MISQKIYKTKVLNNDGVIKTQTFHYPVIPDNYTRE